MPIAVVFPRMAQVKMVTGIQPQIDDLNARPEVTKRGGGVGYPVFAGRTGRFRLVIPERPWPKHLIWLLASAKLVNVADYRASRVGSRCQIAFVIAHKDRI